MAKSWHPLSLMKWSVGLVKSRTSAHIHAHISCSQITGEGKRGTSPNSCLSDVYGSDLDICPLWRKKGRHLKAMYFLAHIITCAQIVASEKQGPTFSMWLPVCCMGYWQSKWDCLKWHELPTTRPTTLIWKKETIVGTQQDTRRTVTLEITVHDFSWSQAISGRNMIF